MPTPTGKAALALCFCDFIFFQRDAAARSSSYAPKLAPPRQTAPAPFRPYGSSRTQMFLKLIGSLLSPCACSLIAAVSYFL